jgi:hypothetical protein
MAVGVVRGGSRWRSPRARLVFAVDATASRSAAWDTAREVTDTLFQALPGELDVALAVHGGSRVHTFTDFVRDPNILRDTAAGISCKTGTTQLVDIMRRTANAAGVKVLLYIGDTFEEEIAEARAAADALKARGIRLIVLHDEPERNQGRRRRIRRSGAPRGWSCPALRRQCCRARPRHSGSGRRAGGRRRQIAAAKEKHPHRCAVAAQPPFSRELKIQTLPCAPRHVGPCCP